MRHLCDPIAERDSKDTMKNLCFPNFSATFLHYFALFSKKVLIIGYSDVLCLHISDGISNNL